MTYQVSVEDWEYSTGKGWSYWVTDEQGEIVTPYGIVTVIVDFGLTSLQFIFNGMVHQRSYDKCYSKQYCATLAKRFAKSKSVGVTIW